MINRDSNRKTRELLMLHHRSYPALQIRDILKFIYQSSFGCEHLVSDYEEVISCIKKEAERNAVMQPYVELLDGDYSRVGLSYLNQGLSAETLGRLFVLSSKKERDSRTLLNKKLDVVRELINENRLPFSNEDFEMEVSRWEADGYPAISHSDEFRERYSPSYRVIANRYVPFLTLFAEIDKRLSTGSVRLAIEGLSASGKTTLGVMLEEIYGCIVLHTDDFFLQPEQRTPERYAEVGGNLDRERFIEEVLIPLSSGEVVNYSRFDCSEMKLQPPIQIKPEKFTVIEGAYSMHPELEEFYNFSVFLDVSPELQKERILKRNSSQMAERFFNEWIPLENEYFMATDVRKRCDLCITICC